MLAVDDEAVVVAFRRPTPDDCLHALRATIPHLTRSSLQAIARPRGLDDRTRTFQARPAPPRAGADHLRSADETEGGARRQRVAP